MQEPGKALLRVIALHSVPVHRIDTGNR